MRIQSGQTAPDFEVRDIFGNPFSLTDFEGKKLLLSFYRMEGKKSLVPADFLIGPDLVVKKAYYGSDISDHMPIQEIVDSL